MIKRADYEKAMNPEVWPYRVGVRHYKAPRRKEGMSWNEQSKQAGSGQVGSQGAKHAQRQSHHHRQQQRYPQENQNRSSSFNLELQNRYQALDNDNGEVFMSN